MEYISDSNKISTDSWRDFVKKHPQGNIFQTPEIFSVYKKTKNYTPIAIFAVEDNIIFGVLLGVIQSEHHGVLGYLSSRCIVWGGPLVAENRIEVLSGILKEFNNNIKNKCLYTQFRNIYDLSNFIKSFQQTGYHFEPHLDIIINLNQSFIDLKNNIHHSRLKNYNKSLKKGVIVKELYDVISIEEGYKILKTTYDRINLPIPDKSLFINIAEELLPLNYVKFYGLYFDSILIGFRIAFIYKELVYDYYAGSLPQHSNKYPNDVLILEILKYGCETDLKLFDFGGAGHPQKPYPVRDYKLQFGGEIVNYGRFNRINNKIIYKFSKTAFLLLKQIKKLTKNLKSTN